MVGILTGDIINSRFAETGDWLKVLKEALNTVAPGHSEIFRGDSFQLEVKPEEAFLKAVYIKACIKSFKDLDVRIAIGIGKKDRAAKKITEANGEAFIFSGEKLETLKKEGVNLAIRSSFPDFDNEINLAVRLALVAMDNWKPGSATIIKLAIENKSPSQEVLAKLAGKRQSTVSEALKRAEFHLIMELDQEYRKKLSRLIK
jgi:hypothetical protein